MSPSSGRAERVRPRFWKISAANRRQILELLGAKWPILLKLFVAEIQEADFRKTPTKADILAIYDGELVRGSRNKY